MKMSMQLHLPIEENRGLVVALILAIRTLAPTLPNHVVAPKGYLKNYETSVGRVYGIYRYSIYNLSHILIVINKVIIFISY